MERLNDLSMLFKLFDDYSRLKILSSLINKPKCVGDLSKDVGMTQSAVSHQLKILKQGGLVKDKKEGQKVVYSIKDDHVSEIINIGLEHIKE